MRVRRGDTLESIAARNRTNVESLLRLNPRVDPVALRVGQRIRVRVASTAMRRLLPVLAALVLAAPALAATPQVNARAWRVENGATGEVLLGHDDRAKVPIASITKLMTVVVALEHARLDEVVRIPRRVSVPGESTLNLRPGERVSVRDLVEAALIQSANDAAYALAYHVGDGSEARFVAMMNAKARALGLTDTHFLRPDGLDVRGHLSSARDVTKLARVAMQRPVIRAIVRRRSDEAAGRRLSTWNDLLGRFPGLIGVKTGHTRAAGWSQVAAARGRGLTIYATILGSPTRSQRNADLSRLLAWGAVALPRRRAGVVRADVRNRRAPLPAVRRSGSRPTGRCCASSVSGARSSSASSRRPRWRFRCGRGSGSARCACTQTDVSSRGDRSSRAAR